MAIVDLHMHSTFSDGRCTPTQLVQQAIAANLCTIALTDHDSLNGVQEALEAAARLGAEQGKMLRVIAGVELTAQHSNGESVHVLGYNVALDNAYLRERMDAMRCGRERRLQKMLDKLQNLGYPIEVEACDPLNRAVGRPHVAKALVAKGYFNTVQEAFDALLHRGGPAYVPQDKLEPSEAVELIHQAGGVAFLAHPSELSSKELAHTVLEGAAFDGIEVYHPSANAEDQQHWLQLARQRNLRISGGSDYHAIPGRFPEKLGVWEVKAEWLQEGEFTWR